MAEGAIFDLLHGALGTIGAVAAPFLVAALVVGLIVALIQAATQLQENALSFVPKLVVIGVLLIALGPWMLSRLCRYGESSMHAMVQIGLARR